MSLSAARLLTNKRVIQAVGLTGCAAMIAAFAVSALTPEPEVVATAPPPANVSELTELLGECRRTWHPDARERLAAKALERSAELESPLVWVLGQPDHACADEAIWLAAQLGLESTAPPLRAMTRAGAPARRALALQAAEAVLPWDPVDLEEFLVGGVEQTALAALGVLAQRNSQGDGTTDAGVLRALIELLEHPQPDVRQAAVAALPDTVPEEAADLLQGRAQIVSGPTAPTVLQALGQLASSQLNEVILVERLGDPDPATVIACLDALSRWGEPLQQGGAIVALAGSAATALDVRRAAFRCLERTQAFAPADFDDLLEGLPPALAIACARCLLAAGDLRGVSVLVRTVEQGPDALAQLAPPQRTQEVAAARRLLCQVTGLTPGSEVTAFREWATTAGSIPPVELPDPQPPAR